MRKIYRQSSFVILFFIFGAVSSVQAQAIRAVKYPYAVKYLDLQIENKRARMAFMDAKPTTPNGETVVLFHGKNFNGFYWKDVISKLTAQGFRVIVPDQIGWGKSDKPNVHYSFHLLAQNNKKLLDSLKIERAIVIGHSMGGMLATRFALMFSETVSKLILENPIGLEDYRTFIPYTPFENLLKGEQAQTYDSMKTYQQTYYTAWKPEYEQYVQAQAESLIKPDFPQTAVANALTSLMIYEQPVVYEFKNLKTPTLLIIGQEDRTVVGKNRLPKDAQNKYGQYPELGKKINGEIPNSKLVELAAVGHIPHVQTLNKFMDAVLDFIK